MSYLILVANCFPVRGYTRSIICDTIRNRYEFIPNSLYELLKKYNKCTIGEIREDFEEEEDWRIIETYLAFLREKEFVFFSDHPELFPDVECGWESPLPVTNAVVDYDGSSDHDMAKIMAELSDLRCEALEIRTFSAMDGHKLDGTLEFMNDSSLRCIFLLLRYHPDYSVPFLSELIKKHKRVMHITVHSTPEEVINGHDPESNLRIFYINDRIESESHCGAISKFNFCVNMSLFMESHSFNNCLNKKISIDKGGQIRNCPSSGNSYGHHRSSSLKDALENPGFKKNWHITKDQIRVCKDCEFRYICTDCRVYTEDEKDPYAKPVKCKYDPYSGIWAQ